MPNNNGNPILTYIGHGLKPARVLGDELNASVGLPGGVVYPVGTVLGQVLSGAASGGTADEQTLTIGGTPTGGTFALTFNNGSSNPTITANYNSTVAQTQTLVNAAIGAGNCVVGGGTLPGSTQTFTFYGTWGGLVPLMTVNIAALTGGSPTGSVAHTTPGTNATAGVAANDTQTVAISGSGLAGTYILQFAGAYTAPIPLTSTAAQVAAALALLPTINGAANVAVTGSTPTSSGGTLTVVFQGACGGIEQPLLVAISSLTGTTPAIGVTKTVVGSSATGHFAAYTGSGANDGRQIAKCVLQFPAATDTFGNVTFGDTVGAADYGLVATVAPCWFRGVFDTNSLPGLDANAVAQLGKLYSGSLTTLATSGTWIDIT